MLGLKYLGPIIIGIIIALLNKPTIDNSVEKFQTWLSYRKQLITPYSGKLNRFLTRPFLWLALKIRDWTSNISHSGIKSGLRIALYIYLGGLFLYLFITFVIIIAIIALIGIAFIIYDKLTNPNNDDSKDRSEVQKNVLNSVGLKGKRIYSGTNWFNEELQGRVDKDGNIYKGTNWVNEEKIGRIDNDGDIYEGTNVVTEEKIGHIEKDGTLHKGTNWFNEEKIGRVDKNGDIYKGSNIFNEQKQGKSK